MIYAAPIHMLMQSHPVLVLQVLFMFLVIAALVLATVAIAMSGRRSRCRPSEPFRSQSFYRRGREIWMSDGSRDVLVNTSKH